MRDRKKSKGVNICPDIEMKDIDFIEPPINRE
jgi:hypothetical protein